MFVNIINVPTRIVIMNGMNHSFFKVENTYPQCLRISATQINDLKNRAFGLERADSTQDAYLASYKFCPTRHGCSGATNCDYEYGAPVGR